MSSKKVPSRALFLELFKLVKPFHQDIFKGVAIGPVIGLLSMVPPYLTKLLFDQVAESYDTTLLTLLVLGIVAFAITAALADAVLHYYSSYLNIKLENSTILYFFNHVQHLPYSFFYHRKVGEVASRFQEVKTALSSVQSFIGVIFGQGVFLLIVPPFLFFLNWKLAIIAIITVPLSAILIYWMSTRLRTSWKSVVESHADIDALQIEMLNQIATVKTMQLENRFYSNASNKLTTLLGDHMRAQTLSVAFMIFDKCINVINIGIFTWLGWYFIIRGEMSVGDYVAFTAYVAYLRTPMREFVNLYSQFQQWAVHLDRIFEYLHHPLEQHPKNNSPESLKTTNQPIRSGIEFKNISFTYGQPQQALDGVNINVKTGEVVALIGTSGSGKSTLLRLLSRMETGYQGEIVFDGKPITDTSIADTRKKISIVWQDVELFQGTLLENLTIGNQEVDMAWIESAVKLCCLTEMVATLPDGYNTVITDKAITLSGGQKQRIAIARALIRQTPVLLLDEAMSNLDVETEARITTALLVHARQHQQTIILVTHRLAPAKLVDRVYLLEQGKVIDSGAHNELSKRSSHYKRLVELNQDLTFDG